MVGRTIKPLQVQVQRGFQRALPNDRSQSLRFWQNSVNIENANGISDIQGLDLPQKIAYGVGRIAGDLAGDLSRGLYWRYNHPLAITHQLGEQIPKAARFMDYSGKVPRWATAATGFGLVTALDVASGNVDLTNLGDFGRPKGYSAIFASPEDPTKSEAPLLEPIVGYVVGRKGKLLPYPEFNQERPDVSPEDYQQYKQYQGFNVPGLLDLEKANLLATAAIGGTVGALTRKPGTSLINTGRRAAIGALMGSAVPKTAEIVSRMGLLKGTWHNLDNEPEVQLMGYKVPLSGAAITAGVAAGMYGYMKSKSYDPDLDPFAQSQRVKEKVMERFKQRGQIP
jgi:hypothetical protein